MTLTQAQSMIARFIAVSNKHLTGDDKTGELEETVCDAEVLMASVPEEETA